MTLDRVQRKESARYVVRYALGSWFVEDALEGRQVGPAFRTNRSANRLAAQLRGDCVITPSSYPRSADMTLDHVSTPNGLGPLAAVSVLAERVKEIEEAPSEAEITRRELRLAIREAHAAGHTLRAIGEAAGISHQRVAQLLKKS